MNLANAVWIWVKTMYFRITLNKTTTFFFLFSFVLCFAHALVQSLLYSLDNISSDLTSAIVSTAKVPSDEFAWLTRSHNTTTHELVFTLRMCTAVPVKGKDDESCAIVFQSQDNVTIPTGFKRRDLSSNFTLPSNGETQASAPGRLFADVGAFIQPVVDSANETGVEFMKNDVNNGKQIFLDAQCARVVLYADQVMRNSKREELALIGSEFWLFGISIFAIMHDSIPHLFAGLAFRVLSTGWSAYEIWRTRDIELRFNSLITQGACGVDLFPGYFQGRLHAQIPDVTLNAVALVVFCFLVWRLSKAYSTSMFQRVGAPDHVVRIYRFFLGLFTCLQLSVYVLVTSTALWVDQLVNGPIARISSHTAIYLTLFILTLVGLIPWIATGWYSVRHEKRRALLLFVGIGGIFFICWALMYYSLVFRWTWLQWPFFACITVCAQLVLLTSIAFAVQCRRSFDRGLKHYLHVNAVLEKADFEPGVFEHGKAAPVDADDNWSPTTFSADREKQKRENSRLSETLDFGAHQPVPPSSPPPATVRTLVNVGTSRPLRFSVVLPSLPKLGKHDPWEKSDAVQDGEQDLSV